MLFVTDVPEEFKEVVLTKMSRVAATTTGYSNTATFALGVEALADHFDEVRKEEGLPQDSRGLLIVDGHTTHHSESIKALCKLRNIDLFFLPPNTTHFTQPLDVSCMGPFKHVFQNIKKPMAEFINSQFSIEEGKAISPATRDHMSRAGRAKHYGEEYVLPLVRAAAQEAFTAKNASNGFKACGLLPLNVMSVLKKQGYSEPAIKRAMRRHALGALCSADSAEGEDRSDAAGIVALVCTVLGLEKPPPLWRRGSVSLSCTQEEVAEALVARGNELAADLSREELEERAPLMSPILNVLSWHARSQRESLDRANIAKGGARKPRTKTNASRRCPGTGGGAAELRRHGKSQRPVELWGREELIAEVKRLQEIEN